MCLVYLEVLGYLNQATQPRKVACVEGLSRFSKTAAFRLLGERGFERLRAQYMAQKIRAGRYRDDELDLLPHLVLAGDTALDIGANFGLYSFHLASLVGDTGRIYAFEAVPSTTVALHRVLRSLRVADRVTVIDKAVGDCSGRVEVSFSRRADGSVLRGEATILPAGASGTDETVDVPVTRIDDVLTPDPRITFMKVDVEGADLKVLRGAERLIDRSAPTILIEVARELLCPHGDSAFAIQAYLSDHGYRTYRYDPSARRLIPFPASEATANVLAVHPRRADRLGALV